MKSEQEILLLAAKLYDERYHGYKISLDGEFKNIHLSQCNELLKHNPKDFYTKSTIKYTKELIIPDTLKEYYTLREVESFTVGFLGIKRKITQIEVVLNQDLKEDFLKSVKLLNDKADKENQRKNKERNDYLIEQFLKEE